MIKVSVIMPAYNVEQFIERSVKSVMNQTLEEIELVIINDASTDSTWTKICDLKNIYGEKIKAINLRNNLRQGGARNIGIKEARGEYIAFVDSDDWIKEDMLEKFYNAIANNDADLAGTGRYYRYYSDTNIQESFGDKRLCTVLSGKEASNEIREKYFILLGGLWKNIFKKSIIVENNIWFPEGVSYEDNYFVNLYIAYVTKYINVDEAFYYYRQNEGSTVYRKDNTQLHRIDVEKMLFAEYKRRGLYEEIKAGYDLRVIQRWYINSIALYVSRFGKSGLSYAIWAAEEFCNIFPNYKNNKYYRTEISIINRIGLVVFEFSPICFYYLYRVKELLH